MQLLLPLCLAIVVSGTLFTGRTISHVSPGDHATSGAELYAKRCASCHGKDGRAKTFKAKFNHARDLTDAAWHESVSDERIFNSIMNGRGKMPSFSKKLSQPEIESLVAYVRSLKV